MTRQELYNLIKKEALRLAEEELRRSREYELGVTGKEGAADEHLMSPDWHPYYMRVQQTPQGVNFTLALRDGEEEYFRQRSQPVPDFKTPAIHAIEQALEKYRGELLTVELVDSFNKTEGTKATWQ